MICIFNDIRLTWWIVNNFPSKRTRTAFLSFKLNAVEVFYLLTFVSYRLKGNTDALLVKVSDLQFGGRVRQIGRDASQRFVTTVDDTVSAAAHQRAAWLCRTFLAGSFGRAYQRQKCKYNIEETRNDSRRTRRIFFSCKLRTKATLKYISLPT